MKIGLTMNDWGWRAAAAGAALLFPALVLFARWRYHGKKRLGAVVRELAVDIWLTLVYGNYDNTSL